MGFGGGFMEVSASGLEFREFGSEGGVPQPPKYLK